MSLLEKRKDNKDAILKGIFIRRELQDEGQEIQQEQTSLMQRRGFKTSNFFTGRSMAVTDAMLKFNHLKKHRFVDMRRRNSASGSKRKKSHPIHNRILFGHANNIVKRLSFGYTGAVIAELKEMEASLNDK
jgi:hypothetical protein